LSSGTGANKIARFDSSNFVLRPGGYRISWQATLTPISSSATGGQLQLWAGPTVNGQRAVEQTTVGTQVRGFQISNTTLFTVLTSEIERYISIRNPSGNNAITFAPNAGNDGGAGMGMGSARVSVNLVIECISSPPIPR
jgi:hypothetical protein